MRLLSLSHARNVVKSLSLSLKFLYTHISCVYLGPWRFQWHDGHESFDIFIVPTLEQLMQSPRVCPLPTRHLETLPRSPTDHFSALPVELLEAIAVDLPTSDVLRLRLTARAMAPIFTSKVFWKSRFSINGERGFLRPVIQQEIEGNGGKDVDWRLLYHCTCKLKCSLEFDYQIRIWESLRWLRDATLARCSNKRKQQGSVPVLQCDLPLDFRGRALQGYHNTFYPNTHRESVHLVRPLKRMIAMVLQIDGKIYITGLEFIFDGMPNVLIGYKTPGAVIIDSSTPGSINGSMYKYPGIRFTTEISCLRGFGIYITPGGVHTINVIQEDVTYYLGEKSPSMKSQECDLRLDEVMEVVGTFDVSSGPSFYEQLDFILMVCKQHCKMLDLGVRGRGERKDRDGKDRWDKMIWRRRRMRRGIY